ncbi:DNA-protecting protein DprA [Candidatus Cyrtobacter comes]|uniref:DNA-protecting protein DprA n=1 Tax=Candidatus Cyrtobacter comes TaxID=675776 RepID=A0ABU5L748_9RICK|nr:DNA-processing protein DprA [Candidatus Cyrtobacter comes]MDZ5761959.1 DNA-protecting protein DprA [Candidatus Cyrtobacter comes]
MDNTFDKEILDWLRLIRSPRVGPRMFFNLLSIFGSPKNALSELSNLAKAAGGSNKPCSISEAEKEIIECQNFGAQILISSMPNYSKLLKEIPDFPPLLIVKGNIDFLNKRSIAIVGSRNASISGTVNAQKFSDEISRAGYVIVSGMARGIDTAAHKAALENGTIGIIAGGIDNIYPKENRALYEKMYTKGLIVTEYKIGSAPLPNNFPRRNRIISGISIATVIIEASLKSGAMITANSAVEQGRDVFAVPNSPGSLNTGANLLIKKGASLVESGYDVLSELSYNTRFQKDLFSSDVFNEFKMSNTSIPSDYELISVRKKLLPKLSYSPVSVGQISSVLGEDIVVVNYVLLELELAGKIERLYNGNVVLSSKE